MVDDLISRRAAIEAVNNAFDRETLLTGFVRSIAVRVIRDMPSAQPEQRWIPCDKRMPEEGSYLVWMPFAPPEERIAVAYYCDEYWNIKTPISAWMPLPEPYKGGDTE